MIRFLYLNAFILLFSVIMCIWGICISLLGAKKISVHRYCAVPWAKTILFMCGVRLNVKGSENIKNDTPYIFVSNHQSYFDIFALLAGLPVDFKFILKQELMRIPFLGATMKRAGYISIDRGDAKQAIKQMNMAAEEIKSGASVLIFPEGSRSRDGLVKPFKKGGFHLAIKSGCDLVPLSIIRSRDIVLKGSLRINKGTIGLNIGSPISVKDCSKKDLKELIKRTRETVISQLNEKGRELE